MKVCEKGRYEIGSVGISRFETRSVHSGLLYVEGVGCSREGKRLCFSLGDVL